MIRIVLFSWFLLGALTVLQAQVLQHVDAKKFKELIASESAIILDVRTPQEYSRGHIAGSTAINIADQDFVSKINLLQKDKTILIYCLTGSRSYSAANYMNRIGFRKIYNLQQGIIDWSRQGFQLEQSSQVVAAKGTSFSKQSFDKLLSDNKVVLVDFHAVWCAPCVAMKPIIDKVATDFKGKAKVEKIDVELNKELSAAYQVQTVPGFVIFKAGKKVWSHNGPITYNKLVEELRKHI